MESWVDKVALVTGASSGIGRAIVELLVGHGMKVVGLARRIDDVTMLAEELQSKPGKLYPLQVDLANLEEIRVGMLWIEKNLGVVHLLVNNAAVDLHTTFLDGTLEEWQQTFDVNVIGLTLITKEVLALMKRTGTDHGHIVNVNDTWGYRMPITERAMFGPYITSKFALRAITDYLRLELAQLKSNIKVSSIIPGLVETEMTAVTLKAHPRLALKPIDVANAILWLIQTPETVLIQDMVITPIREIL